MSPIRFMPSCKACELDNRVAKKNVDRPLAIIRGRAKEAARKSGKTLEFFMVEMNYKSLVPMFRAMMTPEGLCQSCGHPFDDEKDIQIEHREPPKGREDWGRLHARNTWLGCRSCNGKKNKKPYSQWLDEEEDARLSHRREMEDIRIFQMPKTMAMPLFDFIGIEIPLQPKP